MSDLLYKVTKLFGEQTITVEAEFVKVPGCGRCELLCDHIDSEHGRVIYARHRKKPAIFFSSDEGFTWKRKDLSSYFSVPIVRFHVLPQKFYLIQLVDGENVILALLDRDFFPQEIKTYKGYKWHGSLGVGSTKDVTLLSEYRGTNSDENIEELLNVYRLPHSAYSCPALEDMSPVLSMPALVADSGSNIRHFHTVFPDTYNPGTWYASSGDNGKQNRVWRSRDAGLTWLEVKFNFATPGLTDNMRSRLLRFTSVVLTKDKIVWATDDNLGINKSALVTVDKATDSLEVALYFDENLMRNLIKIDEGSVIGLSESKNDLTRSSAYVICLDTLECARFDFPNLKLRKCPVTLSLAATELKDSTAYVSSLGSVLTTRIDGLIRLNFKLENV